MTKPTPVAHASRAGGRLERSLLLVVLGALGACAAAPRNAGPAGPRGGGTIDTQSIESITGLKGTQNASENVFKVTSPRNDVSVTVDGRQLEPFLGLTSWAAFAPGQRSECIVMADLVLLRDEIDPVMSAALDHGLEVTALHNHFTGDEPKVYFLHVGGEGATADLARGLRAALDAMKPPRAARRTAADVPATSTIPAATIDAILGTQGQAKDGLYKAVFGREVTMSCGCTVGKEMGVNTWMGLAGSPEAALVDGDFVTLEDELQPTLKALRAHGISVVAIHNHMEGESPRAVFVHYWGVGRAEDLARGIKAALDVQPH